MANAKVVVGKVLAAGRVRDRLPCSDLFGCATSLMGRKHPLSDLTFAQVLSSDALAGRPGRVRRRNSLNGYAACHSGLIRPSMYAFPHRILVADDNHDTADLTADRLRRDGHEVRTVYDGRQAVETARTFHPHLVILDIQMPVMDGCAAACALRAQAPYTSIVVVAHTAFTQPADLDRVRRAGFDRYLSKPSAPGALEALVTNCLVRLRSREGSSSPL